jgi:hypothetical protein
MNLGLILSIGDGYRDYSLKYIPLLSSFILFFVNCGRIFQNLSK